MTTTSIPATSVCRSLFFNGKTIAADVALVTAAGQTLTSRTVEPVLTADEAATIEAIRARAADLAVGPLTEQASTAPTGPRLP